MTSSENWPVLCQADSDPLLLGSSEPDWYDYKRRALTRFDHWCPVLCVKWARTGPQRESQLPLLSTYETNPGLNINIKRLFYMRDRVYPHTSQHQPHSLWSNQCFLFLSITDTLTPSTSHLCRFKMTPVSYNNRYYTSKRCLIHSKTEISCLLPKVSIRVHSYVHCAL